MNQPKKLIKTKDMAEFFGVTYQTIQNWRDAGMPFVGSKKSLRYDLEKVIEWHKSRDNEGKEKEVIEKNYSQQKN